MQPQPVPDSTGRSPREARHAVRGAFFGFFVDNYDIYLPVIALAPALVYFVPKDLPASTTALITSWIFVATLIGRPIGSLVFGVIADTIGRRRATIIAASGFSVITLLIALLPGHSTWGIGAVVALVALRFVDGVFLGGEYSGANTLAMEQSAKAKRGVNGGLIQSGSTLSFVVASLITLVILKIAPAGAPDSAYAVWGWRIPFLFGAAVSFGFLVYYIRNVKESNVWNAEKKSNPVRGLLKGDARRSILQLFVMMTGMWLLLFSVTAVMPGHLRESADLDNEASTWVLVILFTVMTAVFIGGGHLGQLLGRRTYLLGSITAAALVGAPAYYAITQGAATSFTSAAALAVLTGCVIVAPWAVVTPYISERFQTESRATGFGLGYSMSVIIPGFYATYQLWLGSVVPEKTTIVVLVVIGCVLAFVGAFIGPETKTIDFDHDLHDQSTSTSPEQMGTANGAGEMSANPVDEKL
ncbi:MFS transporter [Streptomyces sp. NPDC058045]|uniref:MFS transporter n=1 Tax=Streptomyces sp. NPDC058045 TaxID=3346311 RepID=UPI0036EB0184